MKLKFLINDHVLFQRICNMECDYCYGFYHKKIKFKLEKDSIYLDKENYKLFREVYPIFKTKKISVSKIVELSRKVLMWNREHTNIPILKISGGGELFLFKKESMKLIRELSPHYKVLQILTNATLLDDDIINKLKGLGNVHLQLSVDGLDTKSNFARVKNASLQQKIIENIKKVCKLEIPLEINCVITKYNCNHIFKFAKYLSKFKNVILVPRPIRGMPKKLLEPSQNQAALFKKQFFKEYERNMNVLPPKAYMEELILLLENKQRSDTCLIPNLILSSFDNGDLDICTCSSKIGSFGNIFLDNKEKVFNKLERFCFKSIRIKRLNECIDCMNQYNILNLYFNGKISDSEISKIPLYSDSSILQRIKELEKKLR